ncbi:MAG: FAD-dependent oxidoreductase [Rhizomicrobium sp.]
MSRVFDFAVIGAGMAGASLAAELAREGTVLLVEREDAPGRHTTGRSAALYSPSYGNAAIRALTLASRPFFDVPPDGFAQYPLLSLRGCLHIARPDQMGALAATIREAKASGVAIAAISPDRAWTLCPMLRPDYVAGAALEPDAADIDVAALHDGYLRSAKAHGGVLHLNAEVIALEQGGGFWSLRFADGSRAIAAVVVNAAGAWADVVATRAGVEGIGLRPLRRTVIILDPPPGLEIAAMPFVLDADEAFYFKPESGRLLASPADETPSEPCDAMPEEMDIAICVDRIQQAADIEVRRVRRSWAGLRSFVADRTPVIGFDPAAPGFFWFAGQGGYGIQTAPAAAKLGAALAAGKPVPRELTACGVSAAPFAAERLRP